MSEWKLIIEDDVGKTIVVPLVRDEITIGRKEGNTIRLTERNVSRFHAKLSCTGGSVSIEDLGSYNGIKINGDRIKGTVGVSEGDLIEIGDYHLALQQAGSADAEPLVNDQPDDEFAGDTQRWEPPDDLHLPSPGMATVQEGRPVARSSENGRTHLDEPTVNEQAPSAADPLAPTETGAALPGPDPVSLDGPPAQAPALPSRAAADPAASEVTVKQSVADLDETMKLPAPQSDVGAAPPGDARAPSVAPPSSSPTPMPAPSMGAADVPATGEGAAPGEAASNGARAGAVGAPDAALPTRRPVDNEPTGILKRAPGLPEDQFIETPRLVVINTIFAGSAFPIHEGEAVIGRVEDNDIIVEHRSVSRNHAKVIRTGDTVRLIDLKSANGILVNGQEFAERILVPGDIIELGRVKIRFVPGGERFVLSPDEIERARLADVAGDEPPEPIYAVAPGAAMEANNKQTLMLVTLGGVIFLLVMIIVILLMREPPTPVTGQDTVAPTPSGSPRAGEPEPAAGAPAPPGGDPSPKPAPTATPSTLSKIEAAVAAGRYRQAIALQSAIRDDDSDADKARALIATAREKGAQQAFERGQRFVAAGDSAQAEAQLDEISAFAPGSPLATKLGEAIASIDDDDGDEDGPAPAVASSTKTRRARLKPKKATAKPKSAPKPKPVAKASSPANDTETAKRLVKQAQFAVMNGRSKAALKLLKRARSADPNHAPIYRVLARVYEKLGKTKASCDADHTFLKLDPYGRNAPQVRKILAEKCP